MVRAVEAWRDRKRWRAVQVDGMARDFSWRSPAKRYAELYRRL